MVAGPSAVLGDAPVHPGPRVTIALYGDSVAEAYTVPDFLHNGLAPALMNGLVGNGFSPGGTGFIPATPFRWKLGRSFEIKGKGQQPATGWQLDGFGTDGGLDGPSGYSALTSSPAATAVAPIDAPTVAVLYTKYAGGPSFTAAAGGHTWTISTNSTGPAQPTETWLTVPAGAKTLTITGPSVGELIFAGAISRRPVTPGTIQVEIENLGHLGHLLGHDLSQRVAESIVQQRFSVSIFLASYLYLDEATGNKSGHLEKKYAAELRKYIDLTRTYGGLCIVADPTPVPVPANVIAHFAAIDRSVAKSEGCVHTSALAHLWSTTTAVQKKLTLVDDIHPTAAGYRLMVTALMPTLNRLVRQVAKG